MRTSLRLAIVLTLVAHLASAVQAGATDRVAPVHPAVPDRVEARFVPAPLDAQTIGGLLGDRMAVNARKRLLEGVDTDALLKGYRQRPGQQTWIGEHIGKFIDAATNAWAYGGDPQLKAKLDTAVRDLLGTQLEVGGVLYFNPPRFEDPRKSRLATAFAAAAGDLVVFASVIDGLWSPVFPDSEEGRLLRLKSAHAALHNSSRRQALPTAAPERHYAFLRVARDGSERLIVVLNFQPQEQAVQVDLSGVDFETATDLESGARNDRESPWRLRLPAYGHRFFRLSDRKHGRA